ncbi:hypothetical protein B0T17DRAFT_621390 [Bombardia bombarda]|uniref:Uncharacterized protein n=1 Tax=Bombardia bombarda TaxID=252184 RepID=A0AA39TW82_9PEZI|nr:hypothetical protein B0T17DRAFT_621390 [Bombardia bombarda]
MAICRFYQQGFCRNGGTRTLHQPRPDRDTFLALFFILEKIDADERIRTNCRFEHPAKPGQQQQKQQAQSGNRFSALSGGQNQGRQAELPYSLSAEVIERDLRNELPTWILSCYGPGRDAPEQLFGGHPREQSLEEIRLHYMQGAMSGNPQGALTEIEGLYQNAQQQINHTLSNINPAIQFIVDAANKHPNRIDVCKQGTQPTQAVGAFARNQQTNNAFGNTTNSFQSTPSANPFGAPAATTNTNAFGQAPTLGQKANPFGAPAFGQPAPLGNTSAFGQPGPQPTGFGQASTLGAKPNPFGQPAFGQTASLGPKPNPFGTAFGGAQQPASSNPFGQPAQTPSPFGQVAANTTPTANPFGQPAVPAPSANPFGRPPAASNPFGQPTLAPAPAPTTNPFGAPAAPAPAAPSGLGQPPALGQKPNPFGTPGFGQPAAAAPAAPASNPFGQPLAQQQQQQQQQPPATTNPFGAPAGNAFASLPATTTPAAAAPGKGPYAADASRQHPDISAYASNGPDGRLRMFKGKPVVWQVPKSSPAAAAGKEVPVIRNFDGSSTRVWFPTGAPPYTTETEADDRAVYGREDVRRTWESFMQTGRWEGGSMPEVPPLREFCAWDF